MASSIDSHEARVAGTARGYVTRAAEHAACRLLPAWVTDGRRQSSQTVHRVVNFCFDYKPKVTIEIFENLVDDILTTELN